MWDMLFSFQDKKKFTSPIAWRSKVFRRVLRILLFQKVVFSIDALYLGQGIKNGSSKKFLKAVFHKFYFVHSCIP